MTLMLASMQVSPRILISFVRDGGTQWPLGILLGTFACCLAALPAARAVPAPVATVSGTVLPAVNDPSTAISCIDRLTRVLTRRVSRAPPESRLYHPPHVLRVVLPWIDLDGLLNTAIEQIRACATTDAAVSLRLLRLLGDVAGTVESEAVRRRIVARGRRVVEGCRGRLPADDFFRVEQRQAVLEGIGGSAVAAESARRHAAASVEEVRAVARSRHAFARPHAGRADDGNAIGGDPFRCRRQITLPEARAARSVPRRTAGPRLTGGSAPVSGSSGDRRPG